MIRCTSPVNPSQPLTRAAESITCQVPLGNHSVCWWQGGGTMQTHLERRWDEAAGAGGLLATLFLLIQPPPLPGYPKPDPEDQPPT